MRKARLNVRYGGSAGTKESCDTTSRTRFWQDVTIDRVLAAENVPQLACGQDIIVRQDAETMGKWGVSVYDSWQEAGGIRFCFHVAKNILVSLRAVWKLDSIGLFSLSWLAMFYFSYSFWAASLEWIQRGLYIGLWFCCFYFFFFVWISWA